MNIFFAMKPDIVLDSVKQLDFSELKSRGITTILLDFDNTLGPDHATSPTDFSKECVETLKGEGSSFVSFQMQRLAGLPTSLRNLK